MSANADIVLECVLLIPISDLAHYLETFIATSQTYGDVMQFHPNMGMTDDSTQYIFGCLWIPLDMMLIKGLRDEARGIYSFGNLIGKRYPQTSDNSHTSYHQYIHSEKFIFACRNCQTNANTKKKLKMHILIYKAYFSHAHNKKKTNHKMSICIDCGANVTYGISFNLWFW